VQAETLAGGLTCVTIDLVARHADLDMLTLLTSGIEEAVAKGADGAKVESSRLTLRLDEAATLAFVSTAAVSEP
jgi:hypothetical protein